MCGIRFKSSTDILVDINLSEVGRPLPDVYLREAGRQAGKSESSPK
jgi:hypothetical protein